MLFAAEVRAADRGSVARTGTNASEICSEPDDRLHDGFFVRVEAGAAWVRASVRDPLEFRERSAVRGIGQSSAVSLGGTPWPGWVLGANLWATRIDPTFVEGGRTRSPVDDSVKWTLARVGPFVSFYPDPRAGFHTDAALSLALSVESDELGKAVEPGASGPALAFGLGHEWFVSAELSLGVFTRATFVRSTRERAGRHERALAELLELGISYTYH